MASGPVQVELRIDGLKVAVAEGTTVLEAARSAGVEVPHLCWHPRLPEAPACCRLCLVKDTGRAAPSPGGRKLTACSARVEPGMVIWTDAPELTEARRGNLAMLRARCGSECSSCLRSGDCRLEALCFQYGIAAAPPGSDNRDAANGDPNPFFTRDNSKCVLCRRCLMFCERVQGTGALAVYGRGERDVILGDASSCLSCGNCVALCPSGALTHRYEQAPDRPRPFEWVETVCGYCGAGCRLELGVAGAELSGPGTASPSTSSRRVVAARPADGPANRGFLCVKGAYGWGFIHHPERLTRPLARRPGAPRGRVESLEPVTWEQALDLVAARLAVIRDASGPEAVGGLASAKCTNEENYLFQKLFRQGLGTNNIDHCARL